MYKTCILNSIILFIDSYEGGKRFIIYRLGIVGCAMRVVKETIIVISEGYMAIDLTGDVKDFIDRNKLKDGLLYLSSREPGVVVTLIEYEPNLLRDLEKLLELVSSYGRRYVAEAILGKTAILPVINGDIYGGVFKHPVLIDLSKEPGSKEVLLLYEGL